MPDVDWVRKGQWHSNLEELSSTFCCRFSLRNSLIDFSTKLTVGLNAVAAGCYPPRFLTARGIPRQLLMTTLKALGYDRSRRFIRPTGIDQLPAGEFSFALRNAGKACGELESDFGVTRFEGVYVLQEKKHAPSVPVVYVVTTESENAARRIHQFVWNQNQSPFLIIESPSTVRLYQGFQFQQAADGNPFLASAAKSIADILERLAAFKAESIDDGTIWKHWAHAVDPTQRVDEKLLSDLRKLDRRLQDKEGMSRGASHGLIGKYVYLKYLRARDILSDKKLAKWEIPHDNLFTKHATLKAFRRVNEELQEWLNGSVFSLGEDALSEIKPEQLKLVARVFAGDSPMGMTEIQSALFDCYDFAHIPIETLSCVYEQFLHDAKEVDDRPSRGKTLGAYYTPLPLADYVLSEMDRRRPLKPGMTVLDPACGSGAFLVQCYRRLIERQRRTEQRELKASELRDLLTKHIFGIDRDDDACRVAELSLIMTQLDYIEPPDLEHTNFKLPSLRDQNIFQGDFFDTEGPVFDLLSEKRFDWVVGNPPWAEVKGTPAADHEHFTAFQWMHSHKKTHPTNGNQLAEAFLWKAGEHLTEDGACGLVVLAMTWFKKEATVFRQRFFTARRVWCLANFANLAYVLFAGRSERPASVIFFEHAAPAADHVIQTFAPFVAEQLSNRPGQPGKRLNTWNIVVSSAEMREINQEAAASGDSLTWKLAMWGTSRDQRLLAKVAKRFKSFSQVADENGLACSEGPRVRSGNKSYSKELVRCDELVGKKLLNTGPLRGMTNIFEFPSLAIEIIEDEFANLPTGEAATTLKVCRPPLISVDAARRFAVFSDEFLATPAPNLAISGPATATNFLRALSLYLTSAFARYDQFFRAGQWGVDSNRAYVATVRELPTPIMQLEQEEVLRLASLQVALAESSKNIVGCTNSESFFQRRHLQLINEANDVVAKSLKLRPFERWLVEDFVQLHMELNKGKFAPEVARAPTSEERQLYLTALRDCLDGFFAADRGVRHKLEVLMDRESALMAVSLVRSKASVEPVVMAADNPASNDLKTIRDRLRNKHSQWVYFDRNLKVYDPQRGMLYQFKPLQRLHWTRRQAVLDADDIIAETLSEGGV